MEGRRDGGTEERCFVSSGGKTNLKDVIEVHLKRVSFTVDNFLLHATLVEQERRGEKKKRSQITWLVECACAVGCVVVPKRVPKTIPFGCRI